MSDVILTSNGSLLSRKAALLNASAVSVGARCVVSAGASLHGERGAIRLGADVAVGAYATLSPVLGDTLVCGALVVVGAGARVEARALGDGVHVGTGAHVGPRAVVCAGSVVCAESVLAADARLVPGGVAVAPFTGDADAALVATMPTVVAQGLPARWVLH